MEIENGKLVDESSKVENTKTPSKIYFFVIAIAALLATNAYYAIRYKNLGKEVQIIQSEKSQLELEVDRIEAELNRVTSENLDLAATFETEYKAAQELIESLRTQLSQSPVIDQSDLLRTQQEIRRLRALVQKYSQELAALREENAALSNERNDLKASVESINSEVKQLQQENSGLENQIRMASDLKVSVIHVNAFRERGAGRLSPEDRARRVDRLEIGFNLANNPLAQPGDHPVYVRITEPTGNLITNGDVFRVNNEELQYTEAESINFKNDGELYTLSWAPADYDFQKGTYTVILYSDKSIMGRSTVHLK
jgi:FtsZ-binding cell division protein ZapB